MLSKRAWDGDKPVAQFSEYKTAQFWQKLADGRRFACRRGWFCTMFIKNERRNPMPKLLMILMSLMAAYSLSGCAVAVGAGAAVVADKIVEEEEGGDGLF